MYNVTKCRIQFQYSESTITQARIQCYSPSAHAHRAQKDANLDRDRDRLETPIGNPKFESISVSLSTSAVYSNNWNYNYSLFNRRRKRVPYSNIDTYDHQIGTNITQPPSIGYRPGRQLWHNARAKSARITRRQGSSKPPSTTHAAIPIAAIALRGCWLPASRNSRSSQGRQAEPRTLSNTTNSHALIVYRSAKGEGVGGRRGVFGCH
eukprot:scaffold29315_cov35-Tisochrysis_lutea.AAC.2